MALKYRGYPGVRFRNDLVSGKSRSAIGKNIATEEQAGKSRKQAIAIAMSEAGKSKDVGGIRIVGSRRDDAADVRGVEMTATGEFIYQDPDEENFLVSAGPDAGETLGVYPSLQGARGMAGSRDKRR